MAATLGQDTGTALRPLTTDFHEPGFAATLAREDAFTQAKGFRFQLRDEDRRQGAGAQWPWGPTNAQALNRYAYVLNNPLRYTDPTGHCGPLCIPAAVAVLFTEEVILEVVALFVVYSFVTAVITCSQDPGCSSVLGRFADQLNQGAITVQQFLNSVQRSLAQGSPSPEVTYGHGARHLEGTNLEPEEVEAAIDKEVKAVVAADPSAGSFYGRVTVKGQTIEFRAYPRGDGTYNVGTYYPVP